MKAELAHKKNKKNFGAQQMMDYVSFAMFKKADVSEL